MENVSSEDLWKAGSGKYARQCGWNEVFYICCTFHVCWWAFLFHILWSNVTWMGMYSNLQLINSMIAPHNSLLFIYWCWMNLWLDLDQRLPNISYKPRVSQLILEQCFVVLYNKCCVAGMFTYIHLVHKHTYTYTYTHTHISFLLLSICVVIFMLLVQCM